MISIGVEGPSSSPVSTEDELNTEQNGGATGQTWGSGSRQGMRPDASSLQESGRNLGNDTMGQTLRVTAQGPLRTRDVAVQTESNTVSEVKQRKEAERQYHQWMGEDSRYYKACQQALALCEEIVDEAQERFQSSNEVSDARNSIGLNYGYRFSSVTGYSTDMANHEQGKLQSTPIQLGDTSMEITGGNLSPSEGRESEQGAEVSGSSMDFTGFSLVRDGKETYMADAVASIKRVCAKVREAPSSSMSEVSASSPQDAIID